MSENNILLYYTTLETAEKIFRDKRIRMSLFEDSKDPFEAELYAHHYYTCHPDDSITGLSVYGAEDLQIVCFSKGTFPISNSDLQNCDKTKYSLITPAMFNAYADSGKGMCFLLDKKRFEIDNKIEKREIKYEKDPFAKLNEAHEIYRNSDSPCTYYNMFQYKHYSFSYENELRYFKKNKNEEFVDISNSLLGVCRGPKLSNRFCKKSKDLSVLIALDFIILAKIIDDGIRLFYCGEFNGNLDPVRDGLWELFPAIEVDAQFPYHVCSSFEHNDDIPWNINLSGIGRQSIKIINNKIVSFHNDKNGQCEPWQDNIFNLSEKMMQLTSYKTNKVGAIN
ncbi:hypothetical protein FACS1894161_1170 [Spirochaetia bacterium]|nr:hypothetical protein FACS1894161_1170 [Spirochaetia bacterium]